MNYSRGLVRLLPIVLAVLVVPIAAGIHRAARAQAPVPAAVTIQNFAFVPPTLTVPAGTTVTWT